MSQHHVERPQTGKQPLNFETVSKASQNPQPSPANDFQFPSQDKPKSAPAHLVSPAIRKRNACQSPMMVIEKPSQKPQLVYEVSLLCITSNGSRLSVNGTELDASPLQLQHTSCFYVSIPMSKEIVVSAGSGTPHTVDLTSSIAFINDGVDEDAFVDEFISFISESMEQITQSDSVIFDYLCFTEHDLRERMSQKASDRGGLAKLLFEFGSRNNKESMINAIRSFLWYMYENFEVECREMRPLEEHVIDVVLVVIYDYALFVPHALCLCHKNSVLREKARTFFEKHVMPANLQINYDIEHFAWNMKLLEEQIPYYDDVSALLMYSYQLGYHRTFEKFATNTVRATDNDEIIRIFNKRWASIEKENDELKFCFCDFVARVLENPQAYCRQSKQETDAMVWLRRSLQ